MNSSIPAFRLGLFALTGAMILGTATLQVRRDKAPVVANASPVAAQTVRASTEMPMVTLPAVTVRPSAAEIAAAYAPSEAAIPMLATVPVRPSEEEVIAANIDPTDRIQIFATMTVRPETEELAALLQPQPVAMNTINANEGDGSSFGAVFTDAVVQQHRRLRLDMPYYSFGRVLVNSRAK